MASSPTRKTERFSVFDPTTSTSTPQQPQEDGAGGTPAGDDPQGATTCCKCPVCTCGSECSCPKGEKPGCDPCATFLKGEATTTSSGTTSVPSDGASASATNTLVEPPPSLQTNEGALDDPLGVTTMLNLDDVGSPSCYTAAVESLVNAPSSDRGSTTIPIIAPTTTTASAAAATADDPLSSGEIKSPAGSEAAQQGLATGAETDNSNGAPGGSATSVTPEEQKALRKERRERARNAKRAQTKRGGRSRRYEGKRRWATNGGGGDQGKKESAPDPFDEWLGVKLKAWRDGEAAPEGADAVPPEDSGVVGEFDFDPTKDELAFPSTLSPLQRGQVHGWAMQLALFHASSGEDTDRHVIISKTGTFQGKVLTRGGRTWYKEGVIAPVVERFALQQGNERAVKDMVASLHSFHESVQLHEPGYANWLRTHAPGSLDGADLAEAQEAFLNWPLLRHGELKYIDTPAGLSSLVEVLESCKEFGFDLEAHNARTYHGLTCLLQISTEDKDYVVDPLAEGMWDSMPLLRGPFGSSDILKIGHSIRSCDVPSLYRDFGIVIVNAFDTEEAVHALGEKHSGLGRVLENAGVKEQHDIAGLKQSMQACDWRERPLSAEKLVYARCDSHYLIPLWRLLRARLLAADTMSNREDAQEERELQEIKRRLEKEQQEEKQKLLEKEAVDDRYSTGSLGLESEFDLASASPGFPLAGADGKPRGGSGSVSPVLMPGEPWTSEWDDPEDCHKRERSRSGSSFRSGLDSINESDFGRGMSVRNSFTGVDGALQASFQEDDVEEEGGGGEEASGFSLTNGNDSGLSFADLGDNLMEEDEPEEQDDNLGEDEDEDMWDGWGQDEPSEEAKGDAPAENPSVANGHAVTAPSSSLPPIPVFAPIPEAVPASNGHAPPIPDRVGPSPDNSSDALPPVSPPPPSEGGEARGGVRRGGGRPGRRGPEVSPQPEQHVLLTDGVRLMWKALSRAQLAAAVLWRPAAPAKRKDSHNERHFRTAVQRLKPPRWTEVNVKVYEEIYLWRDRTARRVDDGATYVCPGDTLIDVALALPTTLDALRRVSAPLSPVLGHGDTPEAVELVCVLRVALGLPEEEPEEAGSIGRGIGAGAVNGVGASGAVGGEAVGEAAEKVGGSGAVKSGAGFLLTMASVATVGVLVAFAKRRNS